MRKSWIVLAILAMFLPVLLMGCEGDDGAPGAAGAPGLPGDPGDPGTPGPGALANETCGLCHASGKIAETAAEHADARATGTVTANITAASFDPVDNTASVTFTFSATDAAGNPVTVDLTAPGTGNLTYLRFTIARLVPGTNGDSDSWDFYGPRSHRNAAQLTDNGGGSYTFTFDNTVELDPAEAGFTHRVGFELNITNFPAEARLRSVNPTFDFVPNGGAPTTREIVTTAACNECHDPLGYTPSFHGSRRVDTKYCVLCHNTNDPLAPQSPTGDPVPIPFVKLIHGVHDNQSLLIFEDGEDHGDFTEVKYPQDLRNCTKCHQGGTDSDNWKTSPSIEACGSCHGVGIFAPGGGHPGGSFTTNASCATCHLADEDFASRATSKVHRTENVTPNNPLLPPGLVSFEYGINSVTVDNTTATIKFFIKKDGAFVNLGDNVITRPAGFSGGPSFVFAYAMEQDGISTPVDYNNKGRTAGQPQTLSIINLPITAHDNAAFSEYTVTVANAFPAEAKMRAVALQGYFSQDVNNTPAVTNDDVGRHTPSVQTAVTGDAVRRTVVKSGYTDNDPVNGQPVGCLECHEIFEGHGGNRVNNVQVCVMCHNPNLSSSGRTVPSADANPDLVAELGPDPLDWPEATNNMKELIHGIHAATDRPYHFVRNSAPRIVGGNYYNWSEVTFPGDLTNCEKCHLPGTYNEAPANALWTTEITTDRATVPNDDDLVNSPTASACFYCHDTATPKSHMVLQGGKFSITRDEAWQLP